MLLGVSSCRLSVSLLSLLLAACKSVKSPLQAGMQNQQAVVELLKDEFAVLSLPQAGHVIGFAATRDYNLQTPRGARQLKPGQHATVSVAAPASAETGDVLSSAKQLCERLGQPQRCWTGQASTQMSG